MIDLPEFIDKINKSKGITPFHGRLLALDPGETTGWALIENGYLPTRKCQWQCDQIKTWPEHQAVKSLGNLFKWTVPALVVFESYHIYDWKSDDHKWSSVRTVQVIGSIWTHCVHYSVPFHQQTAQVAKGFWTDDKLKQFEAYEKGLKHGRDAMRHALHYLSFGKGESSHG